MTNPVIVTGCGRSGTHWLGFLLKRIFGPTGAAFEPPTYTMYEHVVVDSRLRHWAGKLKNDGHRIVHLVRDGREVVRSLDQWYRMHPCLFTDQNGEQFLVGDGTAPPFDALCHEWAQAIDKMDGSPILKLEDLTRESVRDSQSKHTLPHWTEWVEEQTETFWEICGTQMEKMGYAQDK